MRAIAPLQLALPALLATLTLLSGCQAPPAAGGPTAGIVQIEDRDAFIDSAVTRLRELDFPPARIDRQRGEIVSAPTTSGQWFEFWRSDSRGGYQLLESSLHTIRRRVKVRVEPELASAAASEPAEMRVNVEVLKERFNAPTRQVTTASGALAIYNERLPTEEGLRGAISRRDQWVSLGRDALLEEYLLSEITRGRSMRLVDLPPESAPDAPPDEQPPDDEPLIEVEVE